MALAKMTQTELADDVADRSGLSRAEVKKVLMALEETVVDNLKGCVRTTVAGVTIEPKLRAATKKRMGRNPQTGEEVEIAAKPASVRVAARVAKKLKDQAPSTAKLKNAL
jgi:nucleoid DNA-binding protein